jgi:hypothetical protein
MNTLPASDPEAITQPSLRSFLLYFLRLGTFGFGGPIALGSEIRLKSASGFRVKTIWKASRFRNFVPTAIALISFVLFLLFE